MGYDHTGLFGLWKKKKKEQLCLINVFLRTKHFSDMEKRANIYSGLMKVRRDSRMTIHPLFRPSSFSKVCAEIWKKTLHCALPIPQSKCAKGGDFVHWGGRRSSRPSRLLYFSECQRHLNATWHFHLRQQPLICDQNSACSFSQCIFSLCRVIYFHNSVALKIPWVGVVWVVLRWVPPCTL